MEVDILGPFNSLSQNDLELLEDVVTSFGESVNNVLKTNFTPSKKSESQIESVVKNDKDDGGITKNQRIASIFCRQWLTGVLNLLTQKLGEFTPENEPEKPLNIPTESEFIDSNPEFENLDEAVIAVDHARICGNGQIEVDYESNEIEESYKPKLRADELMQLILQGKETETSIHKDLEKFWKATPAMLMNILKQVKVNSIKDDDVESIVQGMDDKTPKNLANGTDNKDLNNVPTSVKPLVTTLLSNLLQFSSTTSPLEVTTTVPLAESSSNSLPVNGNATPGDRGDDVGVEDRTSSGLPAADLREAKGEVNKGADGRTGHQVESSLQDKVPSSRSQLADLNEVDIQVNRDTTLVDIQESDNADNDVITSISMDENSLGILSRVLNGDIKLLDDNIEELLLNDPQGLIDYASEMGIVGMPRLIELYNKIKNEIINVGKLSKFYSKLVTDLNDF